MNQIMRLRRMATGDHEIKDKNNGYGHEHAFVNIIEKYGTLHEPQLLPRIVRRRLADQGPDRAQRGQAADRELPHRGPRGHGGQGAARSQARILHPKLPDQDQVKRIFKTIESKDERLEINMYIIGESAEDEAEGKSEEGGEE